MSEGHIGIIVSIDGNKILTIENDEEVYHVRLMKNIKHFFHIGKKIEININKQKKDVSHE